MGAEWRGDHASHDERSGNGMSSGPRSESGVGAWDGRRAEHSRRASGLLEQGVVGAFAEGFGVLTSDFGVGKSQDLGC